MAKLTSRHTVTDHFVEEGTQGLHYCRLEARTDDPPPVGERPGRQAGGAPRQDEGASSSRHRARFGTYSTAVVTPF